MHEALSPLNSSSTETIRSHRRQADRVMQVTWIFAEQNRTQRYTLCEARTSSSPTIIIIWTSSWWINQPADNVSSSWYTDSTGHDYTEQNSVGEKWIRFRFHRLFRVRNTLISFSDAVFSHASFLCSAAASNTATGEKGMCRVMRMSHSERKWKCSCDGILSAANERNRSKVHFGSFHWLVVVAQHHSFFPQFFLMIVSPSPFDDRQEKRCDCIQTLFLFWSTDRHTDARESDDRFLVRLLLSLTVCLQLIICQFSFLLHLCIILPFSGSSFFSCHTPKPSSHMAFVVSWSGNRSFVTIWFNVTPAEKDTPGYRVIGIRRDAGQRVVFIQANQKEG